MSMKVLSSWVCHRTKCLLFLHCSYDEILKTADEIERKERSLREEISTTETCNSTHTLTDQSQRKNLKRSSKKLTKTWSHEETLALITILENYAV